MNKHLHMLQGFFRSLTQQGAVTGAEAERATALLTAERTDETRGELHSIVNRGVDALLDGAGNASGAEIGAQG